MLMLKNRNKEEENGTHNRTHQPHLCDAGGIFQFREAQENMMGWISTKCMLYAFPCSFLIEQDRVTAHLILFRLFCNWYFRKYNSDSTAFLLGFI